MASSAAKFLGRIALVALAIGEAGAQAPGVPIETLQPLLQNESILRKAAALREAGSLMDAPKVAEQLKTPKSSKIDLTPPSTKPLQGREVAARARAAYLRLGWNYLCSRCDKWHLQFSGAYAISADAVVTCHHCVVPRDDMREGYLIALDHKGEVRPVTAVLAKSQTMDAAILRVGGEPLSAVALQDNVAPGDVAYCFSEPLGQHGYFSTGIVNRFYWQRNKSGPPGSVDELKSLRVNVSTEWAPGSSGAAVFDGCGNVIGHVATISALGSDRPKAANPRQAEKPVSEAEKKTPPQRETPRGPVLITLHEAIPARAVRALAEKAGQSEQSKEAAPVQGAATSVP